MNLFHRLFSFKKGKQYVKVYSHPRSGTHFMEAFLAANFYPKENLKMTPVVWGHWSNRQVNHEGNPYGRLFGNHYFADRNNDKNPKIYILRDVRAVAYSVWKTPNFIHPEIKNITFSEFLRTKIDWLGSPAKQIEPNQTIVEHWIEHVNSWQSLAKKRKNILIVHYEELIEKPFEQYRKIRDKFFKNQKLIAEKELCIINLPVGLLPNKATKDSWKNVFSDEDNEYCLKLLPEKFKFKVNQSGVFR